MATFLRKNEEILLNFTLGTILVLKPAPDNLFYVDGTGLPFDLNLFNKTGDNLLCISFSPTRITFKDYARRSLGDGRGKEQTVDMNFNRSLTDTVSIHHYPTDSEFGRYQILLNGITVYHFDKRLPGPATQISYKDSIHKGGSYHWGPEYWDVGVYQIGDLLPEDRLALVPGRAPLKIPSGGSSAVSIRLPFHSISNQVDATSISWDDGKEIRWYYPGPSDVLHEYAYSASKDKNSWYYGSLHTLKIVSDPTSSIAVVRFDVDTICIFYQDPNTDFIQMGSSFSIISHPTDTRVSRIYYQDPELHLRECYYDHLGTMGHWVFGGFNPGAAPRETPITAEVVQGGDVDINVTWRDARGRVVSASWSKSSGWELPNSNDGRTPLDGRG